MRTSIYNEDIIGIEFDGEAIYYEDYITDEYNNREELYTFFGFDGTITVYYDTDSGERTEVHTGEFHANYFKDFTMLP